MNARENMIHVFNQVDNNLAVRVACAIGVAAPQPVVVNQNQTSLGLSIDNYPLPKNIKAKKVAILTGPGIDKNDVNSMYDYLNNEGAYVDLVGLKLRSRDGLFMTQTYLTTSSVLCDVVYVPNGNNETFHVDRSCF
jgi:catalase